MRDKLILFDWGNIVESHQTGYTNYNAWNDTLTECGYPDEQAFYILDKYRLSARSTEEEFRKTYNQMKEDLDLTTSYEEFVEIYTKYFDKIEYYPEVVDYEVSLNDKCMIGILSDLNILDEERIDRQLGLSRYDYVFLSFKLGCKKPELEIYEKVQSQLNIDKKNILFIDDKLSNIEAAKEFGWNVYQATGLELDKIKEVCDKFINGGNINE